MNGYFDDRKRQTPSVYTVPMKRLLTEGVTDEMPKYCTTRFNLMAFIKQGKYMLNPAFKSRRFNFFNHLGAPTGSN